MQGYPADNLFINAKWTFVPQFPSWSSSFTEIKQAIISLRSHVQRSALNRDGADLAAASIRVQSLPSVNFNNWFVKFLAELPRIFKPRTPDLKDYSLYGCVEYCSFCFFCKHTRQLLIYFRPQVIAKSFLQRSLSYSLRKHISFVPLCFILLCATPLDDGALYINFVIWLEKALLQILL